MADKSNAYAVVIADLKRQRGEIDAMIAQLEAMADGSPAPPKAASAPKAQDAVGHHSQPRKENPYLGMSIVDATKGLLASKRKTMNSADIVAELEAGGLVLTGAKKSNTVGSVLNRRQNKVGDVVSVTRGMWGLKEWYPGRSFGKKSPEGSDSSRGSDPVEGTPTEPSEPEQPFEPPQIVPLRSNE